MNEASIPSHDGVITRKVLDQAFESIATKLQARNMTVEFYLFGGANMVYTYRSRSRTAEVDASFRRSAEFTAVLEEVASELGLPRHWVDVQAYRWEPDVFDWRGRVVFEHPNFRVVAASPEHMYAMKLKACENELRADKDLPDIEYLNRELEITSIDRAREIYDSVWPEDRGKMPSKALRVLEELGLIP